MSAKILNVNDLSEDTVYLALRYFNSKTVTWQPCKFIKENTSPDRVCVKFLEDGSNHSVRVKDEYLEDSMGKPTLKLMSPEWVQNTLKRELEVYRAMHKRMQFLEALVYETKEIII
jgi:hypothetical protein